MATVYPTAAGTWSTRTWNDDATGAAYGMAPQAGDTVLANGLAITIDVDITVAALSTRVGTTAVAGGSFTTSGTRTVNADSYAGTTSCLTLSGMTSSVQNGNSYGSDTTVTYGTIINSGCVQNGNATGGNGSQRVGTLVSTLGTLNGNSFGGSAGASCWGAVVSNGGTQTGDSYGGSVISARGTVVMEGGVQYGNAYGGSGTVAYGTECYPGGWIVGNSIGGTAAAGVSLGGIQVGNATGGSGGAAHGTTQYGGVFYGAATSSNTHDASGLNVFSNKSSISIVSLASGSAANRFGVLDGNLGKNTIIILSESGTHPKSLTANAITDYRKAPFAETPTPEAIAEDVWSYPQRSLTPEP